MAKMKYGIIQNGQLAFHTHAIGIGASEVFSAKSGRWVVRDGSGYIDAAAGSTSEELLGTIEFVGTAGSSDGDNSSAVQRNPFIPVEMPIYDGAAADASITQSQIDSLVGTSCAIKVSSNVQYADLDDTTDANQLLIIEDGDADENTLYCRKNIGLTTETEANSIV